MEQSGSRTEGPVNSTAAPSGCWHLNTCIRTVCYLFHWGPETPSSSILLQVQHVSVTHSLVLAPVKEQNSWLAQSRRRMVFSCICGWSSWIPRVVPGWWPGSRLQSNLILHNDSLWHLVCNCPCTVHPAGCPLPLIQRLCEYRNELLGMRDRLLDSHFALFFWDPHNSFITDGRKEHSWVSFNLSTLQKSWNKVICLFSF